MFSDLGDQQHVFYLLDEWANADNSLDLTYLAGSKSAIVKEITSLLQGIHAAELETIKKKPSLKIGFSVHSIALDKLLNLLAIAYCPSFLSANLSEIKQLLLQAQDIELEIKGDRLQLDNNDLKISKDQLDRYRKGRPKNAISGIHKTLANTYKDANQPSFKEFVKYLGTVVNDESYALIDGVTLDEVTECRLNYTVSGVEHSIKLTSIQTKLKDYKKWIAENII